jgi:hypothetical protein
MYFARHGISVVGFFEPLDAPDELVYIIDFDSAEQADERWKAFAQDPEWLAARASTEGDGPLAVDIKTRRFVAAPGLSTPKN